VIVPKELADIVLQDPFIEKGITTATLENMSPEQHNQFVKYYFNEISRKNDLKQILSKYPDINWIAIGCGRIMAVGKFQPEEIDEEDIFKLRDKIDGEAIYIIGDLAYLLEIDGGGY